MAGNAAKIRPTIRFAGVFLLAATFYGAILAAEKGDLGLMLMLLAFFCFIAPPVVIGRLPGRWLGVSEMLRDELNKDVLKTEDHEDRLAYFVSMAVSFLVSAATVVITFL